MTKEKFIGLDVNKDRNIMLEKVAEIHKKAMSEFWIYKKHIGAYQELQRQKTELLNKITGVQNGK